MQRQLAPAPAAQAANDNLAAASAEPFWARVFHFVLSLAAVALAIGAVVIPLWRLP